MIWLSTSLFCSKNEWNKLFVDGVIPFLTDRITNSLLDDYTIEFNYLDGENIRLSLLTNEKSVDDLTKHTYGYFDDYFSKSNQFITEIDFPADEISTSIPLNNIQFGLYPQTITDSEKDDYSLSIALSHIILDALKYDAVDDDTIFTFAFYLQLALIKSINDIYPEPEDVLKCVYKNLVYDTLIDRDVVREKFEESIEMLNEIKQDIMENKGHENIPEWLEAWMDSCKTEIKKHKKNQPDDIRTIYRKIVYLTIHNHLAITPSMNFMLSYFIEHILFLKAEINNSAI